MRIRRERLAIATSLAAVMSVAAACGGSTNSPSGGKAASFSQPDQGVRQNQVDYGLIYDQTGPTAATQVPFGGGFKAYMKKVNTGGGVNGRQVNVLECDEQYKVAPAMACLTKLIKQTPVVGLQGLNNSSFQASGTPVVIENKVPVIGPESTSKGIVSPFPGWVWAMECTYPNQADVAVAFAAKQLGKTSFTAVGLGGNVASADAYLGQVQERVQKAGARYLKTVHYEYGAPNLDQQAQEIASLKPDVIFTHGGTAQNVTAFKSLDKYGVTSTLTIGIFAQETPAVALASPKVGAQYYAVNCYSNAKQSDVPGAAQMVDDAKAAGYGPDIYESTDFTNGYVVAMVTAEAMKRAGDKLTRQSLNQAVQGISNFDTNGLSPSVSFGSDNSVGIKAVRPYKFNYGTSTWEAVGSYASYAGCNANEFQKGSIDAWAADCIKG